MAVCLIRIGAPSAVLGANRLRARQTIGAADSNGPPAGARRAESSFNSTQWSWRRSGLGGRAPSAGAAPTAQSLGAPGVREPAADLRDARARIGQPMTLAIRCRRSHVAYGELAWPSYRACRQVAGRTSKAASQMLAWPSWSSGDGRGQ